MSRKDDYMELVDEWANKFIPPLTRSQACQVLLDDHGWDYKNHKYIFPTRNQLGWKDWDEMCLDELYELIKSKEYITKYRKNRRKE